MKTFSMHLSGWKEDAIPQAQPFMDAYILEPHGSDAVVTKRPAVVILPGSGYFQCCPREGEPVAMEFLKTGCQAFVVYYRCQTDYPAPLLDVAEAFNLIRDHADEWYVDADKIIVLGFSAGGHLAALLSTTWNDPVIAEHGLSNEKARPNGSILCYPVITSEHGKCHEGSFYYLLGEEKVETMRDAMSLEKRVTKLTPPAFIWTTATDAAVPIVSSLRYAQALVEHGIGAELHLFPRGPHGSSLCRQSTSGGDPSIVIPEASEWIDLAENWLKRNFME